MLGIGQILYRVMLSVKTAARISSVGVFSHWVKYDDSMAPMSIIS
jgi:hypothetical protein